MILQPIFVEWVKDTKEHNEYEDFDCNNNL